MKKSLLAALCAMTLFAAACSSDDNKTSDTPGSEQTSEQAAPQHMADEAARKSLTAVYDKYHEVKDALVKSDAATAKTRAGEMAGTLSFDTSTLTADEKAQWEAQKPALQAAAEKIARAADIKEQRTAFSDLSMAMDKSIAAIGLYDKTVYKQFCPMALDDRGAIWIASEEKVYNPYFGDEMLTCGSVEQTMKY
jgi:Cu(I)/Ag(I) efflux system membrane fusion protein